ncbi:hypothetical protein [Methylobacterium tarhaniae]|uniref:hypothetical protein n=1 Tax=Methylobacterium tarhaniae TaxID=1187852 RepID=UPI003D07ED37
MARHIVAASLLLISASAPIYAQNQPPLTPGGAFVSWWIDFMMRCTPRNIKDPSSIPEENKKYCNSYAKAVNDFFGTSDGGFAIAPDATRRMNDIEHVVVLGDEAPCDGTTHVPENDKYKGQRTIAQGTSRMICTRPVPASLRVQKVTCMVEGGNIPADSCRSKGDTSDCNYAATVYLTVAYSNEGRHYCWWAYNQAAQDRLFSVSFK